MATKPASRKKTTRAAEQPPAPARRIAPGWIVLVTVAAAYAYFLHALPFTNAETRWALVRAIVEQHSLSIDVYQAAIGDKALVRGHYYTDKAPGSSFLGVPFYAVLHYGSRAVGATLADATARELVRYVVVSLPSAVLAWLLFRAVHRAGCPASWSGLLALAYALGTPALPYSTLYYAHQIAALLLFGSFLLIVAVCCPASAGSPPRPAWYVLLAGLLAGVAILAEHPMVVLAGVQGLYLLFALRPRWQVLLFAAGIVPGVAATLLYNWSITGHALEFPYRFEVTPAYREEMATGLYSVTHPTLDALWLLTFSFARGIFVYSPFLLLAAPGIYYAFRSRPRLQSVLLAGALALAMLLFNAAIDAPEGGWSCGPRYLNPGLPFLTFACYPALLAGRAWWWRPVFAGLAAVAIVKLVWATGVTPHVPEPIDNVVTEFWWPLTAAGVTTSSFGTWLGLTGLWSLVPLVALMTVAVVLLFAFDSRMVGMTTFGGHPSPGTAAQRWSTGEGPELRGSAAQGPAAIARGRAVAVGLLTAAVVVAVNLAPTSDFVLKSLGRAVALRMNGADEAATREFEHLLAIYDGNELYARHAVEAHAHLGERARAEGNFAEAEAHYRAGIALTPHLVNLRFALAIVLENQQRPQEAVEVYREAFELDRERLDVGGRLAWLLATHRDDSVREGAEAVAIATELCAATQYRVPQLVDTLAAALAETGDFDAAVQQSRVAVQLARRAGDANLAQQIYAREQLYARGQPYRE